MVKLVLSFATLLLINYTLAQPGKTDSLLNKLKNAKDDTAKVMLLRNIGVQYANQDPRTAIYYWMQGVELSRKINFTMGLARNFINIGTGYSFLGKYDSTIIYADSGIRYSKIINDPDRLALAYLNKSDGYRLLRNYKQALIYCDTASIYAARTGNTDRQARIYDIMSDIYAEQKQYAAVLIVRNKALELYKKDNNKMMEGQVYDDFGLLFQQMGDLDSALIYHKKAIAIGESVRDDKNLSYYYYGAASIYTDMKNYREAEQFAARSLEYAKQQENNVQLATLYSLLSKIYLAQKKYNEAIQSGNMAYGFAVSEVEPSWQVESAGILAQAYSDIGNYQQAHRFLMISTTIRDSLNRLLLDEEVAKLQSSFELKEKDKEILLLNKDKELQQQKIKQQSILVAGAVLLALLALTGTWLLVNRNKLKQRMKEMELRNQIAADLHDEVGSSLSSIHMLSQMATTNDTGGNQKNIMDKVSSNAKETMDRMSDIVWMIKPGETETSSLKQRMERFANEICSSRNIELSCELSAIENVKFSMEQRKNIYLIFKEALNNSVKYSGTKKIEISANLQNKQLELSVMDLGKGFDTSPKGRGNGLDNMKNRTKELNGKLELISSPGGTTVRLALPV
jgi:two-component system, NarL family, sensor histidine kinase UhpB